MTGARLGHILFGVVGAASAIFVHLLPAPWQLETSRPGAAAPPPAPTAPATPAVATASSRERPRGEPAVTLGISALTADAAAVLPATPSHPAGAAVQASSALSTATPAPAGR